MIETELHFESIRPRIIASRCFGFDAVRYDGGIIQDPACARLFDFVDVIHVCPELSIGLGVPRPKIRLVPAAEAGRKSLRLVQPSSGRDLTNTMDDFSMSFCRQLSAVDGFVLKSKSPSCGIGNAKVYDDVNGESYSAQTDGVFVQAAKAAHPGAAFIDEIALRNTWSADLFLRRLFLNAELRAQVKSQVDLASWQRFHARHKLSLMLFSGSGPTSLGRLLADVACLGDAQSTIADYSDGVRDLLRQTPSVGRHANVLQHALGYLKPATSGLDTQIYEKLGARVQKLANQDQANAVTEIQNLAAELSGFALTCKIEYLVGQSYLNPYPSEILSV